MTWEQTIDYIRTKDEYACLVDQAYLHQDLALNVNRFSTSGEFLETIKIISQYYSEKKIKLLDVGCGNGISSIAFSIQGFEVTAIDPDPSESVGTQAVEKLKILFDLSNINIITSSAEEFKTSQTFDIVYCRQAMHHANDLFLFIKNITRYLKPGGLLLTVRDHVIYNRADKKRFLENHPLQKFYHGENAYTSSEYKYAMNDAGLTIIKELKHFDSVINFYPQTESDLNNRIEHERQLILKNLTSRLGWLGKQKIIYWIYTKLRFNPQSLRDEATVVGRMYSYLCIKK